MKKIFTLLLLLFSIVLGIKAQTTVVVIGSVIDEATANRKVYMEYNAFGKTSCKLRDTTTTDSLGNFSLTAVIQPGCAYGDLSVKVDHCMGSLYSSGSGKSFRIDSTKSIPDTVYAKISYCDTCRLNPKFSVAISNFTVNFTNTSAPADGADEFEWTFGENNTVSTLKNPTYTYSNPGTYWVLLTETDSSNGCSDTASYYVTVPSNPCTGFSANFTKTLSCQQATFTNTSATAANRFVWAFGDGNSSTTANPTHTYASSGTYSVCLTAEDTINGCSDTLCQTITINNSLGGNIFRDNSTPADTGIVYLIQVTIDSTANDTVLTALDSTTFGVTGAYQFTTIPNGMYLLKAALLPGSADYATRIPTYYVQQAQWRNATPTTISTACATTDIELIASTNTGGPGFISGYVSVGANKTGDPLEKIEVVLYTALGTPVAYTYTDINGKYEFSGLAYGSYKVVVEIWGKPCQEYIAVLDATNPSANDGNFGVNTTDIEVLAQTGIATINKGEVKIYPNPASSVVNVVFDSQTAEEININVTDITGKIVKTIAAPASYGNNTIAVNVEDLQNGIYFISFRSANKNYIARIAIGK